MIFGWVAVLLLLLFRAPLYWRIHVLSHLYLKSSCMQKRKKNRKETFKQNGVSNETLCLVLLCKLCVCRTNASIMLTFNTHYPQNRWSHTLQVKIFVFYVIFIGGLSSTAPSATIQTKIYNNFKFWIIYCDFAFSLLFFFYFQIYCCFVLISMQIAHIHTHFWKCHLLLLNQLTCNTHIRTRKILATIWFDVVSVMKPRIFKQEKLSTFQGMSEREKNWRQTFVYMYIQHLGARAAPATISSRCSHAIRE